MYKILFFIIIIIFISGCATTEQPKIQIQRIEIPISVPCSVDIPPPPELNFSKLDQTRSIFDKSKALLADRELQLGYETELLAALQSCVK
jgi:hypothetical protein